MDAAAAAESGTATGSSDASMMFLLQCEEPALLWALRSAIVARLTTPTATARAGEGSTCVTGTGTGMSGARDVSASGGAPARAEGAAGPRAAESGHERGATRSADERGATRPKEWAALLPLLKLRLKAASLQNLRLMPFMVALSLLRAIWERKAA